MCFTEIIKINHRAIKHVIVHEIFITVEVIKSKLIIVILKKKHKCFRSRVFVQNFFNVLEIASGSAVMLIISGLFSTS